MAKQRTKAGGKGGSSKGSAGTRGHGKGSPSRGRRDTAATIATVALLGSIAYFLLFGYVMLYPLVTVPVLVGGLVGLCLSDAMVAALVGMGSALAGGVIGTQVYAVNEYARLVQTAPAYANPDVLGYLYQSNLLALVQANPINAQEGPGLAIVVGVALTGAVAAGAAYLVHVVEPGMGTGGAGPARARKSGAVARRGAPNAPGAVEPRDIATMVGTYVIVAVLSVALFVTAYQAGTRFVSAIDKPAQYGFYAYDGIIYMNAYYKMLEGLPYYNALVHAGGGDSRLRQENDVRQGKFYGWVWSPAFIREPAAFYLWKLVAPKDATGVFKFSLAMCAGVFFLLAWGAFPWLGARAAFVPMAVYPYLLVSTIWHNIFFPDWWAALMVLLSVAMLLRRRWITAAVFALAAAVFREVLAPWLAIIAGGYALFWFSARRARRAGGAGGGAEGAKDAQDAGEAEARPWLIRTGVAVAFLVAFALQYWLHLRAGAKVVAVNFGNPATRFFGLVGESIARKFLQPTSYMMFPYGSFQIGGWVVLVLAIGGALLVLARHWRVQALVVGYLVFWTAWYMVFGVSSSYWGQHVMPVAVAGAAMLAASADRAGEMWEALRENRVLGVRGSGYQGRSRSRDRVL